MARTKPVAVPRPPAHACKVAASKPAPFEGAYGMALLGPDMIRLDLYGQCTPMRTAQVEDGWGGARLTVKQAKDLVRELTGMIAGAKKGVK